MSTDATKVRMINGQFLDRVQKNHDQLSDDTPLYGVGLRARLARGGRAVRGAEERPVVDGDETLRTVGDIVAFYEAASPA